MVDRRTLARNLVPGKCLRDLSRDPFDGRICGEFDPDKIFAVHPKGDEAVEQLEANRSRQRISRWPQCLAHSYARRCAVLGLVAPSFDDVLCDARLRDLKSELEQFPWIRGGPQSGSHSSSAGSGRPAPCRSAVVLPVGTTSNASSRGIQLCSNARVSKAG
jgi:hypothetical protein